MLVGAGGYVGLCSGMVVRVRVRQIKLRYSCSGG